MSSLLILVVDNNHFSGPLPLAMWNTLPNIQCLHASDNEFTGVIPSSIFNASNLLLLSLSDNSFSGPIPSTLGNLRVLQDFFLAVTISQGNIQQQS